MKKTEEHREIIARCEDVRKALHLNKSQFSARIGLKPQTYNNFIGAQSSKPNVELVLGIVRAFRVRWDWLMEGVGPMFQDDAAPQAWEGDGRSFTGSETAAHNLVQMEERVCDLEAGLRYVYGASWPQMVESGKRPHMWPMAPLIRNDLSAHSTNNPAPTNNGKAQPERPNCHPAVGGHPEVG